MQDGTDDTERAELSELLLDGVAGLSSQQREAMFTHTFEAPADDEHPADDLIPDDEVFETDEDWADDAYVDGADHAGPIGHIDHAVPDDLADDEPTNASPEKHDSNDRPDGTDTVSTDAADHFVVDEDARLDEPINEHDGHSEPEEHGGQHDGW